MLLIDVLLVAPLGEVSIAALGVCTALLAFLTGIQNALASGTQLVIARHVGAGSHSRTAGALLTGGLINGCFSALALLILWSLLPTLLDVVIHNAAVVMQARQYLMVMLFVLLPSSVSQVMIAYYNGNGKTLVPLFGFLFEIPANVGLSLVLIYGVGAFDGLGLVGAAIGSLVSVSVRLGYLTWRLRKEPVIARLKFGNELTLAAIRGQWRAIFPIAANFVTLSTGVLIYQMLFAQLDVYAYAAITLVLPWMQLGANVVTAWSHATAINVSQLLGQNDQIKLPIFIKEAIRIILMLAVVLSLSFVGLRFALPIFYPDMAAETLNALTTIAPVYILLPLVKTYNGLCGNTLRALGKSYTVLRIHFITQWLVGMPLLAGLVLFSAPLFLVFSVLFIEEASKVVFFRSGMRRTLESLTFVTHPNLNRQGL